MRVCNAPRAAQRQAGICLPHRSRPIVEMDQANVDLQLQVRAAARRLFSSGQEQAALDGLLEPDSAPPRLMACGGF